METVDSFWSKRVVGNSKLYETKEELLAWVEKRYNIYQPMKEFMGLDQSFEGKSVLDFGCGPAFDLCEIIKSKPKRIVGIDISEKTLSYARYHIGLLGGQYVELIKGQDVHLPVIKGTFDFIISSGVIHHTSEPAKVLLYLKSLMHETSELRVMVYNTDSIFNRLVVNSEGDGNFKHYVDGGNCPIARNYVSSDFVTACNFLGFNTEFIGGYTDPRERGNLKERIGSALDNKSLSAKDKLFLKFVNLDGDDPYYNNKLCGLGGVYRITLK